MANYYGNTRSNYFRVKNVAAFTEAMEAMEVEVWTRQDTDQVGITCLGDSGAWPSYDGETEEEIDFSGIISEHIKEKEVCILMEVGNEKLRYLFGCAEAITSEGIVKRVSLADIYQGLAAYTDGEVFTTAEY